MNFDYSEEQTLLRDSVTRFVQDQYDFETRRHIVSEDSGLKADNWKTFAELGWLSIPFSEEHGGFGGSVIDSAMLMEEFGKGLVVEPFIATVLLFGSLLNKGNNSQLQQDYIGKIIEGQCQGAFAYLERQSRYELSDIKTSATSNGDNYTLNGEKTVVFNGAHADTIIVSARTNGQQTDENGITLFLIDANAAGIEKTVYNMMDGQLVANITFSNVDVPATQIVGEVDKGYSLIKAVIDEAMVAVSAEALGVMEKLKDTTVEYAKTREQFGVTLGSFQALQHRMVDMFMSYEQTKSLLFRAMCSLAEDSAEAEKNILALKVMVGRAGKHIGSEAIQLHGGMGITDELDIGHYVKRLMMINTLFGDADYQQQRFSAVTNQQ